MFNLCQNESERVRSGREKIDESEVVEPKVAYLSNILNCYDSEAHAKLGMIHWCFRLFHG